MDSQELYSRPRGGTRSGFNRSCGVRMVQNRRFAPSPFSTSADRRLVGLGQRSESTSNRSGAQLSSIGNCYYSLHIWVVRGGRQTLLGITSGSLVIIRGWKWYHDSPCSRNCLSYAILPHTTPLRGVARIRKVWLRSSRRTGRCVSTMIPQRSDGAQLHRLHSRS